VESYKVKFKNLTDQQITNYLNREEPYDCAGSFKVEGLGISLFEGFEGEDPNSLIGLPLIALIRMLNKEGIDPLTT
jgi:predicted house-cleaning NTP pyrophosphatase (Maf/HAM1 superfamily)